MNAASRLTLCLLLCIGLCSCLRPQTYRLHPEGAPPESPTARILPAGGVAVKALDGEVSAAPEYRKLK